jgi:hypothetical protein
MRGLGGGEGIALTKREFARELYVESGVTNPFVQEFGNTGPSVHSYIIDGAYTVTATAIPSPVRVTEGAQEADGTRTYTVEPLYGLKFLNPFGWNAPPGSIDWYYFEGDSVSTEPGDATLAILVGECRYQTTCRFHPPGPGRMQVEASVETQRARARSGAAPAQQEPKLVLECNGAHDTTTVDRASTVHCAARASGQAALVITEWKFTSGTVTVPRNGPDRASLTWDGTMVQEGDISVAGTVNSRPGADTVHVKIKDRVWSESQPPVIEHIQGCDSVSLRNNCLLLYPPDTVNNLGKTRNFRHTDSLALRAAHLVSGPNAGYSYVTGDASPVHPDSIVVYFNKVLFDSHDFFWRRQHVCSREPLAEWTRNHEYVHVGYIQEAYRNGVANSYSIEAQVYFVPLAEMQRILNGVQLDLFSWMASAADKDHLRGGYPLSPCDVNSILTPSPI